MLRFVILAVLTLPLYADNFVYSSTRRLITGCSNGNCQKGIGQIGETSFGLQNISGEIVAAYLEIVNPVSARTFLPPPSPGPLFPEPRTSLTGIGIYGGFGDPATLPLYQVWLSSQSTFPAPIGSPGVIVTVASLDGSGLAAVNAAIGGVFDLTWAAVNLLPDTVEYDISDSSEGYWPGPVRLRLELAPEPSAWILLMTSLVCIARVNMVR
jgi:hypothetical protein